MTLTDILTYCTILGIVAGLAVLAIFKGAGRDSDDHNKETP